MTISEAQLETWAQPLDTVKYLGAQARVQGALAASPQLAGKQYEVFLHGSFRNGTVTEAERGADLVVQLNDSYYDNVTDLPLGHQKLFQAVGPTSASLALWSAFRASVIQALEAAVGHPVRTDGRSVRLAGALGHPAVRVVIGYQYRRYYTFTPRDQRYQEGVIFFTEDRRSIINHPKLHCEQLARKSAKTQHEFKRFVRIFKHLRRSLVESKQIPDGLAPSYRIEGLLFGVPDAVFMSGSLRTRLDAVVDVLRRSDASVMKTVSGMEPLCEEGCWVVADAQRFIAAVADAAAEGGAVQGPPEDAGDEAAR